MDIINRIDSLVSAAAVAARLVKDGDDPLDVILGLKESLQDFRSEALEAKEQTLGLREQVIELREQLAQVGGHQQDRELYQLQQLSTGSLVYELKEEAKEGSVEHFLCVPCFDDGRHSKLLYAGFLRKDADRYRCNKCEAEVFVPNETRAARSKGILGESIHATYR